MRTHRIALLPASALVFALAVAAMACDGAKTHELRVAGPYTHAGLQAPNVRPETPDEAFRKDAPMVAAVVPFVPPTIHEARLKNGIRVLWVERHDLPVVSVRLVSEVGADQTTAGAADLMSRALFRGTKNKSRKEVGTGFNYLGAFPSTHVSWDSTEIAVKILSNQVDKLSELLSEVVRDANYPAVEVEDARSKQEVALASILEEPTRAARVTAYDLLYPSAHPYKLSALGSNASLKTVSVALLQKLHAWVFDPSHLTITVAGDVEGATLIPILERHFGVLPSRDTTALVVPTMPAAPERLRVALVDRAFDTQANVWIVGLGSARTEAGDVSRRVLSSLLSNRLRLRLREANGWTYGARCGFDGSRGPGIVHIGGAIDAVHAGEAIREMREQIAQLVAAPVSDEKLLEAKNHVRYALPMEFDTVADTTETLGTLAIHHLPLDEMATADARIAAVTADELAIAAKKYLRPDMHVVVVGDAVVLKPQLEALGLGVIEVRAGPVAKTVEGSKHEH